MHIVFLTGEYPALNTKHGGVGSFIKALATELVLQGIQVSVVGIYKIDSEIVLNENGITIYGIPQSQWKVGKFHQNTQRILKKIEDINKVNAIDIVEGSELAFAFFPSKTTYKKVIRMHGGHHFFAVTLGKKPALWRGFQERQSFKKIDFIIAVSNYVGIKTCELLKLKKSFTTIYNPIDLKRFMTINQSNSIPNSITFIGTVCEKKGVQDLILSMKILNIQFPNAFLRIIGRDWFYSDGRSYIEEMKILINKHSIKNIEFIGLIPNVKIPIEIEKSEVCVFPSHMEAMPIAWLEALAMGKPVVASDIPPGHEAIINNKTGLLAKPNDPEDLAEKLIWMLNNKTKALEMGNKARFVVFEKFNLEKLVIENTTFYRNLI